ncbi:MAG: sigma-54-dependent Fis family transcriptional regulator [Ectothiorhodospiraceae bacterium]|nr:sigma-54-dependent Fis family transcriptional regulator [Chromatiales bacterium]MCP5155054.1 sigma-54-dependent Fis family transcriptional regulator [Ectothiorhodospiraceae bacterium]
MRTGAHILVVDDEPDIGSLVKEILEDEGYEVSVALGAEDARESRRRRRPDLVLLDIWMPEVDGISLLKEWAQDAGETPPVVMMSGHGTIETAVEATRLGAYDFIEKPLSMAKLLIAVEHALDHAKLRRENQGLRHETDAVSEPIGRSRVMQDLRERVQRIAQHDTSVLIIGESGSGKEVCARYLHALSARAGGPFVRVPMSGLRGENSAAELFGREEAGHVHFGALEQANGGTLFIEDFVDMEPRVQARLLSAMTHQSFLRVDGAAPVSIDVRVVAATSRDPARAVEEGRLREDLYYRLNVVPIHVPPLRERREDVIELLGYYVDLLARRESLPFRRFTVGAQNRLRHHEWPGNVRELKNLVHRLLILGSGADIDHTEIDGALGQVPRPRPSGELPGFDLPLKEARDLYERIYLEHQIKLTGGNISKLATRVGMERTHLYRKMRALGVEPKRILDGAT